MDSTAKSRTSSSMRMVTTTLVVFLCVDNVHMLQDDNHSVSALTHGPKGHAGWTNDTVTTSTSTVRSWPSHDFFEGVLRPSKASRKWPISSEVMFMNKPFSVQKVDRPTPSVQNLTSRPTFSPAAESTNVPRVKVPLPSQLETSVQLPLRVLPTKKRTWKKRGRPVLYMKVAGSQNFAADGATSWHSQNKTGGLRGQEDDEQEDVRWLDSDESPGGTTKSSKNKPSRLPLYSGKPYEIETGTRRYGPTTMWTQIPTLIIDKPTIDYDKLDKHHNNRRVSESSTMRTTPIPSSSISTKRYTLHSSTRKKVASTSAPSTKNPKNTNIKSSLILKSIFTSDSMTVRPRPEQTLLVEGTTIVNAPDPPPLHRNKQKFGSNPDGTQGPTNIWYRPIINHYSVGSSLPNSSSSGALDNPVRFPAVESNSEDKVALDSPIEAQNDDDEYHGHENNPAFSLDNPASFGFHEFAHELTTATPVTTPSTVLDVPEVTEEVKIKDPMKEVVFKIWSFSDTGDLKLQKEKKIPAWLLQGYEISDGLLVNRDALPGPVKDLVSAAIVSGSMNKEDRLAYHWQQLPMMDAENADVPVSSPSRQPTDLDSYLPYTTHSKPKPLSLNYVLYEPTMQSTIPKPTRLHHPHIDSLNHFPITTVHKASAENHNHVLQEYLQQYFNDIATSTPKPLFFLPHTTAKPEKPEWESLHSMLMDYISTTPKPQHASHTIHFGDHGDESSEFLANVATVAVLMSHLKKQQSYQPQQTMSDLPTPLLPPSPSTTTSHTSPSGLTPPHRDPFWASVYPLLQHILQNHNVTSISSQHSSGEGHHYTTISSAPSPSSYASSYYDYVVTPISIATNKPDIQDDDDDNDDNNDSDSNDESDEDADKHKRKPIKRKRKKKKPPRRKGRKGLKKLKKKKGTDSDPDVSKIGLIQPTKFGVTLDWGIDIFGLLRQKILDVLAIKGILASTLIAIGLLPFAVIIGIHTLPWFLQLFFKGKKRNKSKGKGSWAGSGTGGLWDYPATGYEASGHASSAGSSAPAHGGHSYTFFSSEGNNKDHFSGPGGKLHSSPGPGTGFFSGPSGYGYGKPGTSSQSYRYPWNDVNAMNYNDDWVPQDTKPHGDLAHLTAAASSSFPKTPNANSTVPKKLGIRKLRNGWAVSRPPAMDLDPRTNDLNRNKGSKALLKAGLLIATPAPTTTTAANTNYDYESLLQMLTKKEHVENLLDKWKLGSSGESLNSYNARNNISMNWRD